MTSLTTAKFLLFVALFLGPKDKPHVILVNSSPDSIVWTHVANGWNLDQKSLVSNAWPANGTDISKSDLMDIGPDYQKLAHIIAHHDWSHDSVLVLDNGDRVEKEGTKAFYIVNAGAPNQKIYTILYEENDKPL